MARENWRQPRKYMILVQQSYEINCVPIYEQLGNIIQLEHKPQGWSSKKRNLTLTKNHSTITSRNKYKDTMFNDYTRFIQLNKQQNDIQQIHTGYTASRKVVRNHQAADWYWNEKMFATRLQILNYMNISTKHPITCSAPWYKCAGFTLVRQQNWLIISSGENRWLEA